MKKNQENVNIKGFHFAFKVCIPFSSSSMQNNMVNQENSATMGWIDVPVVKSPCCSYIGPRCVSQNPLRWLTTTYNSSSRDSNL